MLFSMCASPQFLYVVFRVILLANFVCLCQFLASVTFFFHVMRENMIAHDNSELTKLSDPLQCCKTIDFRRGKYVSKVSE
jgi:hypothetical protein